MQKLIFILFLVLGFSCGSRKVETNKIKESINLEATEKTVETENKTTQTKTVIIAENDEIEITPIDNSKMVVVNGKEYKNARIRVLKSKNNTVIQETKKEAKKQEKQKAVKLNQDRKEKPKTIEKKNPGRTLIFIIAFLVLAAGGFYYLKK
jgi:tyrosyl-tRNA synthetase